SDDNEGRLAYNLGGTNRAPNVLRTNLNWVNNVMSWELSSDNTNNAALTEASLGSYVNRNASVYRCPADRALSSEQRQAGWPHRNGVFSRKAMVGDAGDLTPPGKNKKNLY